MKHLLLTLSMLGFCGLATSVEAQNFTVTDTIFDRQAYEETYAFGADLSGVPMYPANSWRDKNGVSKDIMQIMKEQGINSCRLRVWTVNSGGSSKQEVVTMAKRAKAAGMSVMIDFHYSDTWADPGSQTIPSAWTDHSVDALAQNVYTHTYDVLSAVKAAGVTPRWVQVGNETKRGMLYPVGQTNQGGKAAFARFVKRGYDAVKAVDSTIQVIVHLPDGHDNSLYRGIFDGLKSNGAKWDIIGMSAYPRWSHLDGPTMITKVMANIKDLKARYGTPCMVVETGHYPTEAIAGNQYIVGLIDQMIKDGDLTGCYYWAPETLWGYNMGAWDTETKRPTVMMDAFLGIKHTAVYWIMKNSITSPTMNQVFALNEPVTFAAEVKHIRNRAMTVSYYADYVLKGKTSTAPYELQPENLSVGHHQMWSVVQDAAKNEVVSDTVDFFVGESAVMNYPVLTNTSEKGGTAEWTIDFKSAGKYMLEFCYSATDRLKGTDIFLGNDSIVRIYFPKKDKDYRQQEIEVKESGEVKLVLKATNTAGLPVFHALRVYPLEGQEIPEEKGAAPDGIEELEVVNGETLVEVYTLSGTLLGRMTAAEAGLPASWDGQSRVMFLPNSVGGTPNIVRKQRLK